MSVGVTVVVSCRPAAPGQPFEHHGINFHNTR
jgi:hypothetical protein